MTDQRRGLPGRSWSMSSGRCAAGGGRSSCCAAASSSSSARLVALALASCGLQTYKFSPASVIGFRIAMFVAFAALLGLWLVRPLGRRVTDLQVALYVEEHEPSLQAAILSAVDIGAASEDGRPTCRRSSSTSWSSRPSRRRGRSRAASAVGRASMKRHAVALGGDRRHRRAAARRSGPEFLRQGASALLVAHAARKPPARTRSRSRRAT